MLDIQLSTFDRFRAILLLLLLATTAGSVQAQTTGGVILRWTAPGDDNYTGRASGYDIRYQPQASGPIDTETEWNAAAQAPNAPHPSQALAVDSILIQGLTIGAGYYFALRSYDEVGNISVLSNSPLIAAKSMNCCLGKVGNVNGLGSDEPTISDISMLIDHLFISGHVIWCPGEADVNQSGGMTPEQGEGGDISIGDISTLIDHLFITSRALLNCY